VLVIFFRKAVIRLRKKAVEAKLRDRSGESEMKPVEAGMSWEVNQNKSDRLF